jgi:uncharacterized protein YndB with AHSA1/START domain
MPITEIRKDTEACTMAVESEWDATVEQVWELWADPRKLERWWGPPTWPASVEEHDLRPGGRVSYVMTGPESERSAGYWDVVAVEPPHVLEVRDGFADESGAPNDTMPTMLMRTTIEAVSPTRTRMTTVTWFPSLEAMEQLVEMGMEEGLRAAMSQIDAVLAETVASPRR